MSDTPKQRLSSIVKNNAYMVAKVAKFVPAYAVLMVIEGIVWGAINSATAVFTYNLLNAVDGGGDFWYAAKLIGIMALFNLLVFAFDKWYWRIQNPLMKKKLYLKMFEELFSKAQTLDLACFDDPEFNNDFVMAMEQADVRAIEVVEDVGKLINRTVSSFTLFGLLFTVDPVVAVILFGSAVISILVNLKGDKLGFEHNKEIKPLYRKKDYINRVFHLQDYAKELRVSSARDLLLEQYDDNTRLLIKTDRRYGKKYFLIYGLGGMLVGELVYYLTLFYMVTLLGKGLEVGGFAAAMGVIWRVRWLLSDLVERITKFAKHSLYIEKYLEFMRFEPKVKGEITSIPPFESLELKNVSFSYVFDNPKYRFHQKDHVVRKGEGNGKPVLQNVNMKICKGDKIAIVGYNGAGKTTLIKLMMRFYDPTEGEILYNGVDIRTFDPHAYRQTIGTVFQDFKIFAASIGENVVNGTYREEDEERVLQALQAADFTEKLATLEKGIHTHLTREFDDTGTNLSGGESQKIAISRVFCRDYPVIIMDEPSSALDPMAEYKLNQSILSNTREKTVIFISHRLSTTRIADRIYLFDGGKLVEEGSHGELLDQDGKYAQMFRLQSEKYVTE